MTRRLTYLSLWFTADPNRIRLTLLTLSVVLMLTRLVSPSLAAFADGVDGGGHNPAPTH